MTKRTVIIGVGGPVGSGKTLLLERLTRRMSDLNLAVITNDIYTKEDALFLAKNSSLDEDRIIGVETGGCPHTAIREDASMNFEAIETLQERFNHDLDVIFLESGGDNLAATFSPDLVDFTIYIIDVAQGEKIPRKAGQGMIKSDLFLINKTDLAPYVGANLDRMTCKMTQAYDGFVHLGFSNRNGRTISHKKYQEGNSRVSADNSDANGVPYYFLINMGGGFVEGEQYQVTIDVNKDAHALVTTQTPTYVYKCERGQLTQQHTSITLEENSYLEYMADEVIPYLRSRYFQTSRIDMDKSAHLIYSDGVTAGWSHEDLPFQYHYFRNLTQIYQDNELVYSDQTLLEPQKQDMFKLGYFEGWRNYNSLVMVSPNIDEAFVKALQKHLEDLNLESDFAISSLDIPGLVLRILGKTAEDNRRVIYACADYFRQEIHGLTPLNLRKNDMRR